MKKIGLLALAAAAMVGTATVSAQEPVYVEDCAQGLLFNSRTSNWFITAQGGANVLFSSNDVHAQIKDRIAPQAALYVGKWINPDFGIRFGANWMMPKGATEEFGFFRDYKHGILHDADGYYPEKFMALGPEFDILINLTNWWCGYNPDRVYNAVLHGGAGFYWTWGHWNEKQGGLPVPGKGDVEWRTARNTFMFGTLGLQNNFRVSDHVQLFLDVQAEIIDYNNNTNSAKKDYGVSYVGSLNAGITYNFGNSTWSCPQVAICPEWKYTDAEGDALAARLGQAENKIRDLQAQLDACLKRKVEPAAQDCEGLVTIYFPINVYTLNKNDKMVLNSVAEIMQNSGKQYVLTGWADNYTGTDEINHRLRINRVNSVKDYLMGRGVDGSQLDATIDNGNLTDLGAKAAPLDRAVTIRNK